MDPTKEIVQLGPYPLTVRQLQICNMVFEGLRNDEIAERLELTVSVIKWHLTEIYKSTGRKDRLKLAKLMYDHERRIDLMLDSIKVVFTRDIESDFFAQKSMDRDKVDYSDVLILYRNLTGHECVFQATLKKGIHSDPSLKEYLDTHVVVHTFEIHLKKKYDYFLGFVNGSCGKSSFDVHTVDLIAGKQNEEKDVKMFGAELVGVVLNDMSAYHVPFHKDSWRPVHIYETLVKGTE